MNDRIKRVRRDLGLNQSEFAREMNVTLRTVQYWESGETVPRAGALRRMASLAEKPVAWFYADEVAA